MIFAIAGAKVDIFSESSKFFRKFFSSLLKITFPARYFSYIITTFATNISSFQVKWLFLQSLAKLNKKTIIHTYLLNMNYRQRMTCALLAVASIAMAQTRREINLKTWDFSRDRQAWETVSVPHDWAIAGPFDKKWDLQVVAIEQNGEKKATEKSGRSGALPWIGKGYYRTNVTIKAEDFRPKECRAILEFDGAMSQPMVYVNGKEAGYWAYGYNAFRMDVTNLVKVGDNVIEVSLVNEEESSRWYPGAGIYRPVKMILTGRAAIDPWATSICTTAFIKGVDNFGRTKPQATIDYETQLVGGTSSVYLAGSNAQKVANTSADAFEGLACVIDVVNDKGAFEAGSHFDVPADGHIKTTITVTNPNLWSPETPYLYKVRTRLYRNHELIDEVITPFGIRTIEVSRDGGFKLNGGSRKLQGVCLHHDLGPLGAAVNKTALIRQILLMKNMGCDAIRTAHNMPSEMQMQVCDSLGMMVMAESFDMWKYPKCKNGYARFFNDWAEKDIRNLLLHHRNHPSIVMWSIGNEIPEQADKKLGVTWSRKLQDLCHSLDPSRPVTQGLDRVDGALASGVADVMDVVGLNYRTHKYVKAYDKTHHKFILGSETASAVSSRGVYKLPYKTTNYGVYSDGQCSSYDNEWCPWSNLPDVDFELMDDYPWTIGQFVWTGIDYLGEPTPYDGYWPSRSSYFGICDLAGLPKDRYYLYRSVWNKKEHTLHITPHWTWGKEMIGKNVPVQVYSDYDEAELFINGKSQGRIKKNHDISRGADGRQNTGTEEKNPNSDRWDATFDTSHAPNMDRYRLRWMDTKYEPGEIKVVAYDKDGKPAMEKTLRTAGEAAKIELSPDRPVLAADGEELCYITVSLTDKDGTLCPDADDEIQVTVEGEGRFKAICNGDATSLESFTTPRMHLFHGMLELTVQSTEKAGEMTVTVVRPASKQKKGRKTITIPEIRRSITVVTR